MPYGIGIWGALPPKPPTKGAKPLWKPVIRYSQFCDYLSISETVWVYIMGVRGAGYGVSPFSNHPPDRGSGGRSPPVGVQGAKPPAPYRSNIMPYGIGIWGALPPKPPTKGAKPLWKPVIRYSQFCDYLSISETVWVYIMGGSGGGVWGVPIFKSPPDRGSGGKAPCLPSF